MKVRIPLMIQDPRTSKLEGIKPIEGFDPEEEFFLDGPVTKRVAVLDFSPKTGKLQIGAYFRLPPRGRVRGWYENAAGDDLYGAEAKELYTPAFMHVSVFATVLKTMYMFEKKDTLGRPLTWAFDAPQLLVVPRAGERANAYYHRDSHSLQFFHFGSPRPRDRRKKVYTCLSRDIVAHETGHAIVDGIAPDLLDACTPQSLAIHEAIADLTAVLMAFGSHTLRKFVLKKTRGSIEDSTAFSSIAEEFGAEIGRERKELRNLRNKKNLNPRDKENSVRGDDPHDLSEVLSGALYNVMIKIHEDLKAEYAKTPEYAERPDPLFSASGEALRKGAERFKRMVFRALDYLPPGEVSFVDYGRAMIAVDQVAYPDDEKMRSWICAEFVSRFIVRDEAALEARTNFEHEALKDVDVSTLRSSDWAAYDFANENRGLLCIPSGREPVPFQVRPRLSVRKKYDSRHPAGEEGRECIFKVAWDAEEGNPIGSRYQKNRRITVGTTLAIDWETRRILARLTSAPPTKYSLRCQGLDSKRRRLARAEYKKQRLARDAYLGRLAEEGFLKVGRQAIGPYGQPLVSAVQAEVVAGKMRVRGTGNMLHIIGRGGEE